MHEFWALVEEIPATFWGVVAGSFFTLICVWLTNRGNDRRLERQLSNDRELRKTERELALRKEIYLAAIEVISTKLNATRSLFDIGLSMNELIKVYSEIPSSIAKANLIAGEETIKAAVYFTNELDAARIKLSAKRYPLEALKNQIDSLSQELKISLESDDRIIEAMKQALFNGVSDRVRFQKMYRILEYERNRIPETIKQRSILAADLFAKQMSFYAECAPVFARLNTLVMPILIAMRKELGLPISENIYVQAYEQNPGIFREPMKEFEENFEQFITTQFGAVEEQH